MMINSSAARSQARRSVFRFARETSISCRSSASALTPCSRHLRPLLGHRGGAPPVDRLSEMPQRRLCAGPAEPKQSWSLRWCDRARSKQQKLPKAVTVSGALAAESECNTTRSARPEGAVRAACGLPCCAPARSAPATAPRAVSRPAWRQPPARDIGTGAARNPSPGARR